MKRTKIIYRSPSDKYGRHIEITKCKDDFVLNWSNGTLIKVSKSMDTLKKIIKEQFKLSI